MKQFKIFGFFLGAALVGVAAAMALTNPNQAAYEEYAVDQLSIYLETDGCSKAPDFLGTVLQDQCAQLIQQNREPLKQFIASGTQRQNYYLLSIYKTNLAPDLLLPPIISDVIPSYHFETVGLFQNFFIFKAQEQ
jgi:Domain of unknown function (DUF4359)